MEPLVPWKQITAMRDKLIHHYFGLDSEIVWESANNDIPLLVAELSALLAKLRS